MKRALLPVVVVASMGAATAAFAPMAQAGVGISVRIGDPYQGAFLHFVSAPRVISVPMTRVYVVRDYDYDLYRYDNEWFYFNEGDGDWYCANTYRGPFVRANFASVPYQVRYVCDQGGNWDPTGYQNTYRTYDGYGGYGQYGGGGYQGGWQGDYWRSRDLSGNSHRGGNNKWDGGREWNRHGWQRNHDWSQDRQRRGWNGDRDRNWNQDGDRGERNRDRDNNDD